MRILVLNWRCVKNPLAGGAEIYFQEIFRRLTSRGHEVTLLAERFAGATAEETVDGIRVIRTGGKWTFNFAAARRVGRLADDLDCDIVIDDLNKIPFYSPWNTKKPVLAILMHLFRGSIFRETLPPLAAYVWLAESIIPWAYRRSRFAVLSESSKKDVVGLGIPGTQIDVIPPGTDFDRFRPEQTGDSLPRHRDTEKEGADVSGAVRGPAPGHSATRPLDSRPVLLHVGRLKRYKSTDHLLQAARVLADRGLSFRVVIVGTGDDKDRLEKLAAKIGLEDRIEFTGFIPEEDKVAWYRRAAVLVENSVKEGWGLIVMEANGCGTPVVVARSAGLVDSSRDGVNGLFYDYGNIAQLTEKLGQLLTDEPLRRKLGEQAIGWARQWTWDKAADDMEAAIGRALAEWR